MVVDLCFPVRGGPLPADHAYGLFGALSRVVPTLHSNREVGILPINGLLCGNRQIQLTRWSRLLIRAPRTMIPELLTLAGQVLEVEGTRLTLEAPRVEPLKPRAVLWSRLVTVKGYIDPDSFLAAVQRQLDSLGIRGRPALVPRRGERPLEGGAGGRGPWVRRTVRVRDKLIVGYAVVVTELTAEESLVLQEHGLGGRRRLGCGIFVPPPRRWG